MRVTRRKDERGAVAVIAAILALLLFAFSAYALDSGNLWQTRRNMVTASDAAALGAAEHYALGTDGCAASVASSLLTANRSDAQLDDCEPSGTSTVHGYVSVKGHANVSFTFAGMFGLSNKDVSSTTTAEWGNICNAVKNHVRRPETPWSGFRIGVVTNRLQENHDASCSTDRQDPGGGR